MRNYFQNPNGKCVDAPCCGCCGSEPMDEAPELPYDGAGFPGCGDGSDDLADFNANEASDYANEGAEDSYLDSSYEDRFEMDDFGGD